MMCDVIILCANLDPRFVTGQVITCKMVFSGLGKTCVKTHVSRSKFSFRLLVAKGRFTPSVSVNVVTTLRWCLQFGFHWKQWSHSKMGCNPHSGVTLLFSMRTESQASSQSCRNIDTNVWCKRTLKVPMWMDLYYCCCRCGSCQWAVQLATNLIVSRKGNSID